MGADLYISKIPNEKRKGLGFEVSEKAVAAGYFRDCYNENGLFAHLSMVSGEKFSWWQLSKNEDWFNRNGNLKVLGAAELLRKIEVVRPMVSEKYYQEWCDLFIKFLKKAIKLKSSIVWSV
jgi:hypothetical protein